ncbi:MAG TPA: DUF1801 domain-containing protein [Gemmatimonadaceae bacterium]|nr:DUF1801 domain-containing protein [Gemmatimonadaceae bacterium]
MAKQTPSTVTEFLAQLPPDRRKEIQRVRDVVLEHLPAGYVETLTKGMIVYEVPLERYAETYNGHALWYAALASQKSYVSLHLMPVYGSAPLAQRLRDGFKAAGKKLDMGKACIRFKRADDLALDAIAEVVASTPVDRYIAHAEAAWRR